MASVWLLRGDCEAGTLPGRCLVCGDATTERVEMDFRGTLAWLDPLLILSAPRVKVRAPTCDAHRHHWRNRFRIVFSTFVLASLLSAPLVAFLIFADDGTEEFRDTTLAALILLSVLMLTVIGMWSITTVWVLSQTGVRAWEILEQGIHLTNVSTPFVEAYEHQKQTASSAVERALAQRWSERERCREESEGRFHGQAGYQSEP